MMMNEILRLSTEGNTFRNTLEIEIEKLTSEIALLRELIEKVLENTCPSS
jgi:hypothetical protein